MKRTGIIIAISLFVFSGAKVSAQSQVKEIEPDKSPADISYYPADAPFNKEGKTPLARVIYSRPQKKGRTVFGELEPFGKVWRTGANESTEIKLYTDATLGDTRVPAGTYSLFTIPEKDQWTIILNSQTDRWGAYSHDKSKDVAQVSVPAQKTASPVEYLTIYFEGKDRSKANLVIAWDDTMVSAPISFN